MDHVNHSGIPDAVPNAVVCSIVYNARKVMSKESGRMWQGTVTMYFNIKLQCLQAFNNVLRIADGT